MVVFIIELMRIGDLSKSKGNNHEGFRYGIRACNDDDVIQKYIDDHVVSLYNDHKGISENNLKDVKVFWNVYIDNMGEYVDVVSVCGLISYNA